MNVVVESTKNTALAMIDGFVIDALIKDDHTFESEVTEYPVESGSTISDNIRPKPIVVTMECLVSNTPLENVDRQRKAGSVPVDDAYALMKAIRSDRRLVDISTSLETFTSMALEEFTVPRAAGRGEEFRFTARFKQVTVVTNTRGKRTAAPSGQDPSKQIFRPTEDRNVGYVYVNGADFTWYDNAIAGWRRKAEYDTHLVTSVGLRNPTFGLWILNKNEPLDIPLQTYRNEIVALHRDALVRPRVIAAQGGKPKPFLFKKPLSGIIMLRPGQYTIQGLSPQGGTGF